MGGGCFSDGGFIFKLRGAPWASALVGGGFEKICKMGEGCPSRSSTMGNPEV